MYNKGIGAGGKNTNISGISFEKKTCIESVLIDKNFSKHILNKSKYGYYFELINNNIKIVYLTQTGFSLYCKKYFKIICPKNPDEAFIIFKDNKIYIKILEKKNQNTNGSVFDKLKTGKFVLREYQKYFNNNIYVFSFAFCVNIFLQNILNSPKLQYKIIKEILIEDNILVFYGDEQTYFDDIYKWIFN